MKIPWKKIILGAIGIFVLLLTGQRIIKKLKSIIVDKIMPEKKEKFHQVIGEPSMIWIEDNQGESKVYRLPKGVTFKDVKAAGISENSEILEVEIKHEPKDRKNNKPIDNNALDGFNDLHG